MATVTVPLLSMADDSVGVSYDYDDATDLITLLRVRNASGKTLILTAKRRNGTGNGITRSFAQGSFTQVVPTTVAGRIARGGLRSDRPQGISLSASLG